MLKDLSQSMSQRIHRKKKKRSNIARKKMYFIINTINKYFIKKIQFKNNDEPYEDYEDHQKYHKNYSKANKPKCIIKQFIIYFR